MVAVLMEERDWLHERLCRWADWARCPEPGHVGTSEGYMRERLDHAHEGEPTAEIEITDKAVGRMRVSRPDYWPVFARFYLNPAALSTYEISLQIGHHEERVKAMLRQSQMLVGHNIFKLEKVDSAV